MREDSYKTINQSYNIIHLIFILYYIILYYIILLYINRLTFIYTFNRCKILCDPKS